MDSPPARGRRGKKVLIRLKIPLATSTLSQKLPRFAQHTQRQGCTRGQRYNAWPATESTMNHPDFISNSDRK